MAPQPGMRFFIGGVVEKQFVGDLLEVLYQSNAEKLDIAPFANLVPIVPQPGIRHKRVKAPSDQTLLPPPPAKKRDPSLPRITEAVGRIMDESKAALSTNDIRAKLIAEGYPEDVRFATQLNMLKAAKKIFQIGPRLYGNSEKAKPSKETLAGLRTNPHIGGPASAGHTKEGGLAEQLLSRLKAAKGKPVPRQEMVPIAIAAGKTEPAMTSALGRLIKWGKATNPSVGMYAAVMKAGEPSPEKPNGARAARATHFKPAPDGLSQEEYVLSLLKKAYPDPLHATAVTKKFEANGMRSKSAGVVLSTLVTSGRATRPEPSTYLYVQPKQES